MTRTREDNPTRDLISAFGSIFFEACVYTIVMAPYMMVANIGKKITKFLIIGGICYCGYKYFVA